MIGGYYVVAIRKTHILALVAGPFADWHKAEGLLGKAQNAARAQFTLADADGYGVAFMAFPVEIRGACNGALWVQPEFVNHDIAK